MIHILIVDDEKIEREGLKYLLSIGEGERRSLRSFQWKTGTSDSPHRRDSAASYGHKDASYGWAGTVQEGKRRKTGPAGGDLQWI